MSTDWLMVIITGIYVIATIFICWANFKSAKASKEQLEELKRQYEKDNRPEIEIEFHYLRRTWYVVRFVNHGKKTAQHVKIKLDDNFIFSIKEEKIKEALLKIDKKECIIGAGLHYDLYIGSNELRGNSDIKPFICNVEYESQNSWYSKDLFIDIKNYVTFFSHETYEDKMQESLNKIGKELNSINQTLHELNTRE